MQDTIGDGNCAGDAEALGQRVGLASRLRHQYDLARVRAATWWAKKKAPSTVMRHRPAPIPWQWLPSQAAHTRNISSAHVWVGTRSVCDSDLDVFGQVAGCQLSVFVNVQRASVGANGREITPSQDDTDDIHPGMRRPPQSSAGRRAL